MMGFILVFMAGGLFGMLGVSILAYGPRMTLMQQNRVLRDRLTFLEKEDQRKQFHPVKDPRPEVHKLVN